LVFNSFLPRCRAFGRSRPSQSLVTFCLLPIQARAQQCSAYRYVRLTDMPTRPTAELDTRGAAASGVAMLRDVQQPAAHDGAPAGTPGACPQHVATALQQHRHAAAVRAAPELPLAPPHPALVTRSSHTALQLSSQSPRCKTPRRGGGLASLPQPPPALTARRPPPDQPATPGGPAGPSLSAPGLVGRCPSGPGRPPQAQACACSSPS
jgi:hypothetical protein